MYDASSPGRHSSITTRSPAAPNTRRSITSFRNAIPSSYVCATATPFPAASPSALTTTGSPCVSRYCSASSYSSKTVKGAVGMPHFRRIFFMKTLDPSICAPSAVRAADEEALLREKVGQPRRQRGLGPDHGEVDPLRHREIPQSVEVIRREGDAFRAPRDTGVPGRGVDLGDERAFRDLPGQGVLAAAAADDEDRNSHSIFLRFG